MLDKGDRNSMAWPYHMRRLRSVARSPVHVTRESHEDLLQRLGLDAPLARH